MNREVALVHFLDFRCVVKLHKDITVKVFVRKELGSRCSCHSKNDTSYSWEVQFRWGNVDHLKSDVFQFHGWEVDLGI